jgi:pyruvate dehydrogenase E2 component (dihydrolipoamide acetyltransferase)
MPQLGETVAEGKITTWFKAVGDTVAPGDNLFAIETDKVSVEVPAISSGVLAEILIGAGEAAPVGAVVAVMKPAATSAPAIPPVPARPSNSGQAMPGETLSTRSTTTPSALGASLRPVSRPLLDPFREVRTPEKNFGPARLANGAIATPLARRLAHEAGIDLVTVMGSGAHRRIHARDVEAATTARARAAPGPSSERIRALYEPGSFEEIPLDAMRRTIVARLVEAKQTIPHFYLTADMVIDRLEALRKEANAAAAASPDGFPKFRLSINDFMIKGLALALQRVPAANAAWAQDRILRFRRCDVAVAVAIDGGLVTPVIRGVDTKSLGTISAEMKDFAARAHARRLTQAELCGGASTISNLGMHGVREFAAIINPPHATTLAVGAATRRPIETDEGGVRFVTALTVTLSCDHRVVDGALGAELLAALRYFIEHPAVLMV